MNSAGRRGNGGVGCVFGSFLSLALGAFSGLVSSIGVGVTVVAAAFVPVAVALACGFSRGLLGGFGSFMGGIGVAGIGTNGRVGRRVRVDVGRLRGVGCRRNAAHYWLGRGWAV